MTPINVLRAIAKLGPDGPDRTFRRDRRVFIALLVLGGLILFGQMVSTPSSTTSPSNSSLAHGDESDATVDNGIAGIQFYIERCNSRDIPPRVMEYATAWSRKRPFQVAAERADLEKKLRDIDTQYAHLGLSSVTTWCQKTKPDLIKRFDQFR
jgi:hypothetical protein